MLATIVYAGLRIERLLSLRWRNVDTTNGKIRVGKSKTDAGVRSVNMVPMLKSILQTLERGKPDAYVFPTGRDGKQSDDNFRSRVLAPAVKLADIKLEADGEAPLPEGLTPHSLRHTFGSALAMLDKSPNYVMGQLGHTDPKFTLKLYTHTMDEDGKDALRALYEGEQSNMVAVAFPTAVAS